MLQRFPGLAEWLSRIRVEFARGILESETPLPFWARLPLIRERVFESIHAEVIAREPLEQKLVNVVRVREPLIGDPADFVPGKREQLSATVTVLGPDGKIYVSRVSFPFGVPYDRAEFRARLASSLADEIFVGDPKRTPKINASVIGIDWYVQTYRPL